MAENDNNLDNATESSSGKSSSGASKYIIPGLAGAVIWVGLLGFGLEKIYSMSDKGQNKPAVETATSTPASYVTPSDKTPANQKDQGIDATSRFAIDMQDDHGKPYTVYLNAQKETSTVQPAPSTIAAAQGDKLFHGDYDTYVAPTGSSDLKKQTVTLPNMTFNLNRKQVYVLKGNPQLLVITQPNDANGITARYYTLISGVLTPVELVRGSDTKTELYMMAMKANPQDRTFVTVEYNPSTKHWRFTTWKADPDNKVLRVVSEQDMTKEQMKATDNKWWVTPSSAPVHANWNTGSTPSHSTSSPSSPNQGSTNGGGGNGYPAPPANNGGTPTDDSGSSTDGGDNSTGGDLYGGGYDNNGGDSNSTGGNLYDGNDYSGGGSSTGGDLYGGYDPGNSKTINSGGSSTGSSNYDPSTWWH